MIASRILNGVGKLISSSSGMQKVNLIAKYVARELFVVFFSFCELFLLIFILLYVFFESVWFIILIIFGIIGMCFATAFKSLIKL